MYIYNYNRINCYGFFCRSEHELCSSMFILWSSTGIIKNNPVSIIIFRVFKKHISSVLDLDTPRAQYKLFEIVEKQPENCLKAWRPEFRVNGCKIPRSTSWNIFDYSALNNQTRAVKNDRRMILAGILWK